MKLILFLCLSLHYTSFQKYTIPNLIPMIVASKLTLYDYLKKNLQRGDIKKIADLHGVEPLQVWRVAKELSHNESIMLCLKKAAEIGEQKKIERLNSLNG